MAVAASKSYWNIVGSLAFGSIRNWASQADFLRVVMAHVEELGHVLLLALHLGVPQVLVAFTAAPEHVVLGAQALGDLQGVLQLAAGVGVDVGER